jgi:ankyrin repeat protein
MIVSDEFVDAIKANDVDAIVAYLGRGGDPNAVSQFGSTLLSLVTYVGSSDGVRLLLESGANHSAISVAKEVPLFTAARHPNGQRCIELLVSHGADVNWTTDIGSTALIEATSKRLNENVRVLLDCGADASRETANGETALSYAIINDDIDSVNYLINKINPNHNFGGGISPWTPLKLAVFEANARIIALLVAHGADTKDLSFEYRHHGPRS